jgi:hypothetical protein
MDDPFDTGGPLRGINIGRLIINLLTVGFLLGAFGLGAAYAMIFVNPQAGLNPYPPPTLPPTIGPPTPTNTPAIRLPTEIPPSATPRPLPSALPTATETPLPTEAADVTQPAPATAEAGAQFELQTGSPTYTSDPMGCEIMEVAGVVYDADGNAILGLALRMGGELAGAPFGPIDTLSGSAADRFGFGGYSFELSDTPVASEETLWIQIIEASSGLPLSEQFRLTTRSTCTENLILVNWKQQES